MCGSGIFHWSLLLSRPLWEVLSIDLRGSVNGGIIGTLTSDLWETYIGSGPKLASVFMSEPRVYNGDKQMSVWVLVGVVFGREGSALSVSACFYYLAKTLRSIVGHKECVEGSIVRLARRGGVGVWCWSMESTISLIDRVSKRGLF